MEFYIDFGRYSIPLWKFSRGRLGRVGAAPRAPPAPPTAAPAPRFSLGAVPRTLRPLVSQLPPLLRKALQAVVRSLVLLTMATPAGPQLQPMLSAIYRGVDLPPEEPLLSWGRSSLEPGWWGALEQKMDMLFFFLSFYKRE